MLNHKQKELLLSGHDRNIAMISLAREYPLLRVMEKEEMLMCRFLSEEEWCHFSYSCDTAFVSEFFQQNTGQQYVVIADEALFLWIQQHYQVEWYIDCYRLFQTTAPKPPDMTGVVPMLPEYLPAVFANSKYQQFLSINYLTKRLELGGGFCILNHDKPVAWVMTHDDGSVGMVHVLEPFRRRGYACTLVEAMSWKVRQSGRPVFAHIEPSNAPSLKLFDSLGFTIIGTITWAKTV